MKKYFAAGLALLVALPAAVRADRPVARHERRLLLVVNLADAAAAEWRWMYRIFEGGTVVVGYRALAPVYRDVHLLAGRYATADAFRRALRRLGAEPTTKAVDVLLQLHGAPGAIVFADGASPVRELGGKLAAETTLVGKLRAVYSAACFGASHAPEWLAGGFRVANGARQVNTNGLWDFPAFVGTWRGGGTYAAAQEKGNHPGWLRFFDRWAERLGLGLGQADSFKGVWGEGTATLGEGASPLSEPLSWNPVASLERLPPPDADGLVPVTAAVVSKLNADAAAEADWRRLQESLQ